MSQTIPKDVFRYFTTSVALITTVGKAGPNVMAAEWTMQVSSEPMLIAVFIAPHEVTHENIESTGEFGVNFCSDEQATLSNVAGAFSRREVDKLSFSLFQTYLGDTIKVPMIKGSIINAECKLVQKYRLGDHTSFIGQVFAARFEPEKRPLVYHKGRYSQLGLELTSDRLRVKLTNGQYNFFHSNSTGIFVRAAVGILLDRDGRILLLRNKEETGIEQMWHLPWTFMKRGQDYATKLNSELQDRFGVNVKVEGVATILRMHLILGTQKLWGNFVVFRTELPDHYIKKANLHVESDWFDKLPRNTLFRGQTQTAISEVKRAI